MSSERKTKIGRYLTPAGRRRFEAAYEKGMQLLPPPTSVDDVDTDFGRVRAYSFGDALGPPIVLLHARGATTVVWQPNLPSLAQHHRVYAIDLLGEAGRSEQTAPIRDADDQAAWLGTTLERLEIEAAHLVGVSFGGWLAANQAVRAPQRVASLSVLEPVSTLAPIPVGSILRTIPTILPVVKRWAVPRFLSWVDAQGSAAPEDEPVGRVIGASMREYRPALPQPTVFTEDELRSISVPTLVLIAGRSVMHDPERAFDRAESLIPNVQAELWPDATHSISGQFADRVNARVLRFVEHVDHERHAA
jgi:pimeloyl-ACP methyl ester carboxylesterase